MPNPLPPETTPEWTANDEKWLQFHADDAVAVETRSGSALRSTCHKYAREIRRLRSELDEVIRAVDAADAPIVYDSGVPIRLADRIELLNDRMESVASRLRSERQEQDAEIAKLRSELAATLGVPQAEVLIECEKCGRVLDGRVGDSCNRCPGKMQRIVRYSAASVPNTGTALSEEERATIDKARVWLGGDFGGHVPRLDELLAIIDRLSSAPSRGSDRPAPLRESRCRDCKGSGVVDQRSCPTCCNRGGWDGIPT
jgi:hypothetical protein